MLWTMLWTSLCYVLAGQVSRPLAWLKGPDVVLFVIVYWNWYTCLTVGVGVAVESYAIQPYMVCRLMSRQVPSP